MKFDTETVARLQNASKQIMKSDNVRVLCFDPKFYSFSDVLRKNPQLKGFSSDFYIEDETLFYVSKVKSSYVDENGVMYINFSNLKFVLSALFDFFVCNDKGLPMDQSLAGLINVLSGGENGQETSH